MLETERSSDEALRQPTYRRLYLGALEIDDRDRRLQACYIILLAGRLGLRTGEIQHVREAWIDWHRGEIAIPQHDPCGCKNCWIAAKQKAASDTESARDEIMEIIEEDINLEESEEASELAEHLLEDVVPQMESAEDEQKDESKETRTAEEILYEERWQPKYERSARRVPFGYSRRLTAVIIEFLEAYEYMEITQPTMMNLVEEAAAHAEGVDPDGITIRGLRGTAATHTATFIRSPKALQDLMGWTRIETAARYLRRAGAFTTDVVYHAFGQGETAPAMYPGEPREQFPLVANPLPYQKEPFNPVTYPKSAREDRADNINPKYRKLIHPRSANPPSEIHYEPTNHPIRTHEDYQSEIIERDDGSLAFKRPTMSEFLEDHERLPDQSLGKDASKRRYESTEEWKEDATRQAESENIFPEDRESQAQSVFPATLDAYFTAVDRIGSRVSERLENRFGEDAFAPPESRTFRAFLWVLGVMCISILMLFGLVRSGLIDLQTMSLQAPRTGLFALLLALFVAYNLPKTDSLSDIFN